jgi:hypothetical protein
MNFVHLHATLVGASSLLQMFKYSTCFGPYQIFKLLLKCENASFFAVLVH